MVHDGLTIDLEALFMKVNKDVREKEERVCVGAKGQLWI